jgi:hypothetical protein
MTQSLMCDRPDCHRYAQWFVGAEFERSGGDVRSRGHSSCNVHLSEACMVTLRQLAAEGAQDARLDVRLTASVEPV